MIYANYAATSPTLSPVVAQELCEYINGTHFPVARNFEGLEEGARALRARCTLAKLFNVADPLKVVFASGATAALNMAIHGLVRPGCHVLATSIEHNAVARPLEALRQSGVIELDWLACGADGWLNPQTVCKALRKNTRLFVASHASNVLGTILPIEECFRLARERGVLCVLDAAQTAGILPLSLGDCGDVIAFTGHKGLGGLAGIGGLALADAAAAEMRPYLRGGTGSVSDSLAMPEFLPDKFEPGTQNTLGVLSLAVSVEEILRTGAPLPRERALTARFLAGLRELKKIKVYGLLDAARSVALVSLEVCGRDAGEVSRSLFENYGIVSRSGLHCAPLAHKTAGTYPRGTVRFSFGRGTTEEDIDTILTSLAGLSSLPRA